MPNFKIMKHTILFALMCLVMCACGEKDDPQSQQVKNPISFRLFLIDEEGNDCTNSIYSNNLGEYITIKYKDKVYEAKKNSQNEYGIYLSCYYTGTNIGRVVEFGGIDGSKEFENESFTIDCGNGETNVVAFSNRKVVTANGEEFVQECKLNGVSVDKSKIVCKIGIHDYIYYCYEKFGLLVSGPGYSQIRFSPVDANGNSLLENKEFIKKLKEGTTFTYRGITSNIETEYTGSKLKLKVTNESFGELEKEQRILFGTFPVNKILKDQRIEINWFDGSKDVVDINFLSHYKALNDPTSKYFDPSIPQEVLDVKVNGVQLDAPQAYRPSTSVHKILLFVHKKVFDWK